MSDASATTVLWWPGRLLAEDDLRRHWTSQGEIVLSPQTIVTPLALDFLKGKRVAIRRQEKASDNGMSPAAAWGIAEEMPSPLVAAAVKALTHEGRTLAMLTDFPNELISRIRAIAVKIANGKPPGVVIVGEQSGLTACIANKLPGLRAATVNNAGEVATLKAIFSPNLFAIAVTGRTFFELRQLLKAATASPPICPEPMAKTLRELDGHAHR